MAEKKPTHPRRRPSGLLAEIRSLLPKCMLQDRTRIERRLKGLQRHGRPDPKVLKRLKDQASKSADLLKRRCRRRPEVSYPESLPITAKKAVILDAIQQNPVVIVAGETGSGKTTQLPKICLEAGRGMAARIACTQPRRVAAVSVSRRIAEELGVTWGRQVGCRIRFKDQTAPDTYIKMMTDGMLLAEVQGDRDLLEYDTIIIDEAHERSLNIDFLLGYLKVLRRRRPDLKLIITSATIDVDAFSRAFDDAPVVEVSGRMYPVEVRYRPMEELLGPGDDYTYIDAAVAAVDEIMSESREGDVLAFMPTEKDIHETRRRLEGRSFRHTEVLPLFGRLTQSDQQRVFHTQRYRRIVLATNIAETSLTIPGIRYVVDTGLARVSRYNSRTQTHRLPVEPISQSSAQQRAGRCGRLSGGICVRLYEESDLESRPEYTQPEIQRANLAEVILRMLALRIGDIETYPFVDPPRPQAVQGGFQLLTELGALDDRRQLTPTGRDMARLPIAPTVSRMVLQAQKEGALREILVIASAISVQDPRVRPLEQEAEADREHRAFVHPGSDFLGLLNIWNTYHDTLERMKSQSQMRRFCRRHFLSYNRMREWRDIHVQLRQVLREIGGFRVNSDDADYDAIHRSVLSGLLSNIAEKKEGNLYRGARSRDIMLFPGSGLFRRRTRASKTGEAASPSDRSAKDTTPEWLMAAEIVETSRIFARTAAGIDRGWIADLGEHLCRASYRDPHWNPKSGRVLITETLTLYGLQVRQRRVPYRRVDPAEATDIFIREALVNDTLRAQHPFLLHNRQVRERVETWQMASRRHRELDLDQAVHSFYSERLQDVSSVHDLNRLVRKTSGDGGTHLHMQETDLTRADDFELDRDDFPEYLTVDGEKLPLAYACRPGQDEDGVTLKLPFKLIQFVQPEVLEWLVPGLLQEKITHLLRGLPKGKRKRFVPVPEAAREIAAALRPTHGSLLASLEAFILDRHGMEIQRSDWRQEDVPEHLRMRIEMQGSDGQRAAAGRDLGSLMDGLNEREPPAESRAWRDAAKEWERDDITAWSFGDLPLRVEVTAAGGLPVYGYPGLKTEGGRVDLRLLTTAGESEAESRAGLIRLGEIQMRKEMKALKGELRELGRLDAIAYYQQGNEGLQEAAYAHLAAHLFEMRDVLPLTEGRFQEQLDIAREKILGLVPRLLDLMDAILGCYRDARLSPSSYPGMEDDLARLAPPDFLSHVPHSHLPHLARYLKAVRLRSERAALSPGSDRQKLEQVQPFQDELDGLLQQEGPSSGQQRHRIEEFHWMLEEYRVSVFAQELGTAYPVSAKRLNAKLDEIRHPL